MTVYLANIILIMLEGYWFLADSTKSRLKDSNKTFCLFVTIQWILVSGLRGLSVGADTYVYKFSRFNVTKITSWSVLKNNLVNYITGIEKTKDPGYSILEKTFQLFSQSYQIWLMLIAILFMTCLAVWIYKNSLNSFLSFIIFSCLFYAFFAITGHRQTIATAFVVFIGDALIRKRKLIPFLLIVLIMSTVHKSCLVFIPFYFLYNKKITHGYVIIMMSALVLFFIFNNQILKMLGEVSGYGYYGEMSNRGAYRFTVLLIAIIIIALWRSPVILVKHPPSIMSYNALLIGMIFVPLVFLNPSVMRVVQYFSVYIMLMIPYIIDSFSQEKERRLVLFISLVVLLLFYLRTNPQYYFFWNDPLN